MNDPEFTFGPRNRLVSTVRHVPAWRVWGRALLVVLVFMLIGVILALGTGRVFAATPEQAQLRALQAQQDATCRRFGEMSFVARSMAQRRARPQETAEVLAAMESHDRSTIPVASAEAVTYAAYTFWTGLTPGEARRVGERYCFSRPGML